MSAEPRWVNLRRALTPGLIGLHMFAAAAVVFTVFMGFWQLGVYDTRQQDERADRQDVPTVPIDQALGPDEAFTGSANHRPVTARGHFGPTEEQLWVSGREHDGRDGYWLVAPFIVTETAGADDDTALLVVRGWSERNDELVATPSGQTEIEAVLEPGEGPGSAVDARRTTDSLRIPLLINELPYDLYAGYGLLIDPLPEGSGLEAVEPPKPDVSWTVGSRNLTYAVEWWVFGLFALFMWIRMTLDVMKDASVRDRVAESGR